MRRLKRNCTVLCGVCCTRCRPGVAVLKRMEGGLREGGKEKPPLEARERQGLFLHRL